VTAIVVAHLLVNIAHGLAHRELRVGLDPPASIFVTVVVLVSPLPALALVWTMRKRIGFSLLSLSMFGSLLFRLLSSFSGRQPRSHPFAALWWMGYHLCPNRVSIAHHGGDWNLRGRSFPLDCQRDFEQSRQNLKAAA